jgi:hypothetical protein
MSQLTTNTVYLAAVSAEANGGPAALRDMVTAAPLIDSAAVIDLDRLCGRDTPDRTWDTTATAITGQIRLRLTLLDSVNLDVQWLGNMRGDVVFASSLLPAGGTVTIVGVTDDDTQMVALVALGDNDDNLQLVVRVRLDPTLYRPAAAEAVTHLRDVLTGVSDVESGLRRTPGSTPN